MAGAFIISRDIFENSIWTNNTEFRMFFLILGKAVFVEEGKEVGSIHVKKGQWLRSYRNLQTDLEYIENNAIKRPGLATIKRTIEKLVDDGRITIQQTELGTLFTIVNYCKYQDFETYKKKTWNDAKNSNGTATEQQRNNNNKDNKGKKKSNIYSPEFEKWYSEYPRSNAKADSFKSFEKIRKEKGIDFINQCSRNYLDYYNSLPDDKKEYSYSSNNFFGQKAYYEDFITPKKGDKPKTNFMDLDAIKEKRRREFESQRY